MFDVAIHVGHGHPSLVWVLIGSVLSFVAGLGVGSYSTTLREWLRVSGDATAD